MFKFISRPLFQWVYVNIHGRAYWWFSDEETNNLWQRLCVACMNAAYSFDIWACGDPDER